MDVGEHERETMRHVPLCSLTILNFSQSSSLFSISFSDHDSPCDYHLLRVYAFSAAERQASWLLFLADAQMGPPQKW